MAAPDAIDLLFGKIRNCGDVHDWCQPLGHGLNRFDEPSGNDHRSFRSQDRQFSQSGSVCHRFGFADLEEYLKARVVLLAGLSHRKSQADAKLNKEIDAIDGLQSAFRDCLAKSAYQCPLVGDLLEIEWQVSTPLRSLEQWRE